MEPAMPCEDPDHMDCPVLCSDCGRWVELDDCWFHVICDCSVTQGCSHGVCPDCKSEHENEEETCVNRT